jgi:zinc/manganese transport system substrate-binding protein
MNMKAEAVTVLAFLMVILSIFITPITANTEKGIITTSFPYIAEIARMIAGSQWNVTPIVPSGVDPHDYSLSISDVVKLRSSTIIVVTNHTYFEQRIIELVNNGELKPQKLIVAEEIDGLKILVNPDTKKPNLHMIYYDPDNLLLLVREIKKVLVAVDPQNKDRYEENYQALASEVQVLKNIYEGKLRIRAVGSTPIVQYAVSWLGVEITTFLIPEHEAQLSPQKQLEIRRMAENREIEAVVIRASMSKSGWTPLTQYDQILVDIARENGLAIIAVPDPLLYNPDLLQCLKNLTSNLQESDIKHEEITGLSTGELTAITAIAILVIVAVTIMVIRKR